MVEVLYNLHEKLENYIDLMTWTGRSEKIFLQLYTHLSSVAARMYFPFGENFTNDTGGLSSSEN